jgi:hypothetical protein
MHKDALMVDETMNFHGCGDFSSTGVVEAIMRSLLVSVFEGMHCCECTILENYLPIYFGGWG